MIGSRIPFWVRRRREETGKHLNFFAFPRVKTDNQEYTYLLMPSALQDHPARPAPSSEPTQPPDAYRLAEPAVAYERRNFLLMALYQVVMRTGWIFKTESVVMPAVLDTVTGGGPWGGLLRGCLPVLNRLGHGIPPLLFARRLKILPQKRWGVFVCTLCMALVFFALSTMWRMQGTVARGWMPVLFLTCYFVFFVVTGINNLSFDTLQGKLIHAARRGRLMLLANTAGATTAIVAALLLMPLWLTAEGGQFELIFGFSALCFAAASVCMGMVVEPSDNYVEAATGLDQVIRRSWRLLKSDREFRRLALVAMAFSSSLVLFPHYQALGRSPRLALSFDNLMLWVVVQNAGTALFSLVAGPLADRHGNRLVIRSIMLVTAIVPTAAILISYSQNWGPSAYPAVFTFVGLTPVGFKIINNYTLEISRAEDHPRYLSTLGLCFALPLLLSPALGWLLEKTSFETVFFGTSITVFVGWLLTFRLSEPRQQLSHDEFHTVD